MDALPTLDPHQPLSSSPLTVELISSEEGLPALENDWNRLSACSESPNVFVSYTWFRVWVRQLIADGNRGRLEPYVLLIRQEEVVVGIVPLVRRTFSRFGLRMRKLEFATYHSDYNEFVVGQDVRALTEAAFDYLFRAARDWDLIDLAELRANDGQAAFLEAAATKAGLPYRLFPSAEGCLYMAIEAPWAETQKKKHLRFARRAFQRLEERAAEGFRLRVVEQPHLETDLLQRMIAVEAQKRVDSQLSAPFIGAYPGAFQSLVNTLGPQDLLAIVVVEKDDELIAYRMLYRCGTKLWDYQTAYHHGYSEISPGTLLLCASIDYGFQRGYNEFDFLRGMDDYKQRWTKEFRRNEHMILWNRGWASRLLAALFLRRHGRVSPRATG